MKEKKPERFELYIKIEISTRYNIYIQEKSE